MKSTVVSRSLLAALCFLGLGATLPSAHADSYVWTGDDNTGGNGAFDSAGWTESEGQYETGPPGGGDSAYVPQDTILSGSGSVGTLDTAAAFGGGLNGTFTCDTLGSVLLTGGTLSASTVTSVSGDSAEDLFIQGAQMTAGSADDPNVEVSSAGSLVINSAIPMGEGSVSGQGSVFEVNGALMNFNGGALNGGALTAQSIQSNNGLSARITSDGSGSSVTVAGNMEFDGQGIQVTNGGAASASGNLLLYPDPTNVAAGGSAYLDGAGSTLTIGTNVTLGTGSSTGVGMNYLGEITISDGAVMTAGTLSAESPENGGVVNISSGGVLNLNTGLKLGQTYAGSLNITGGGVKLAGDAVIGSQAKSSGTLSISGSGSYLNASSENFVVAANSGSTGSVELDTSAAMQFTGTGELPEINIGDGGAGNLSVDTGSSFRVLGALTDLSLGAVSGASGTVAVAGGSTFSTANSLEVGNEGTGSLGVSGTGSSVTVGGNFNVAKSSSSTGSVTISGGAQFAANGGYHAIGDGGNGSLSMQDAGSTLFLNGQTVVGGNLEGNSATGKLSMSGGATAQMEHVYLGFNATSSGSLLVDGSGTKLTISDDLNVGGGGLSNLGLLAAEGAGDVTASADGLIVVARTLRISSKGIIQVAAATDGGGRIYVGTDNKGPEGAIRIGHNGILIGQGSVSGSKVLIKEVFGDVILGAGGRFEPGGDPSVFDIDGDCDLSDGGAGGGETDIDVAGTGTPGVKYDQLVASGKVTLGGTLKLVLMEGYKPGYKPKAGDALEIVKGEATTGSFKEVVAPGLTLNPVSASGKLTVKVMSVADVPPPDITSTKTAKAKVGQAFSYQVTASGLPAGYGASGLPAGLSIDGATGLISGTPATAGTSSVKLTSTSVGGTGAGILELTVAAAVEAGAPVITSDGSATGEPGVAFTYQIAATNTPTSYAATGLPAGLSLNAATGLISGKPAKAETSMVTLSASNASGTGTANLKLVISLPVVKVVATVPEIAVGGGKPGEFTLSIPAALKTALTIHYKVGGSAKAGTDYVKLTGTAVIKAGKTSQVIKVTPKGDLDGALTKVVKLTLEKETGYSIGTAKPVKVTIVAGQ